jgi:hypothetical protein
MSTLALLQWNPIPYSHPDNNQPAVSQKDHMLHCKLDTEDEYHHATVFKKYDVLNI